MGFGTLKVFCGASMRGGGKWCDNLDVIVDIVEALGHMPLTEASPGAAKLAGLESDIEGSGDQRIYERDMKWLSMADCLIAEVSSPSLGVGYEVASALHGYDIPVLALCHESVAILSAMVQGNTHPRLDLCRYREKADLRPLIKDFLSKIIEKMP